MRFRASKTVLGARLYVGNRAHKRVDEHVTNNNMI